MQVNLSHRDLVLIRVALLTRLVKLKDREDCRKSYDESRELVQRLYDSEATAQNELRSE